MWIANPASLVQSAVPRHLNDERLRQLELACLQSDIVFVDEADAVQMRLDQIFAPSATLVQPGPDSWLDQLHTHKIEELSRRARLPLTDVEINRWNSALGVVSTATDVLYRTLIADEELRQWADMDYFSPWTLQEKLLADWFQKRTAPEETYGVPDEHALFEAYENDVVEPEPVTAVADARRRELTELFDAFRDDPLGRRGPYGTATDGMIDLARDLLHSDSMKETRARTRTFLERLLDDTPAPVGDGDWVETTSRRLEFMLLLSALNHRLDRLTFLWPQVEAALRLDNTGNELARRPRSTTHRSFPSRRWATSSASSTCQTSGNGTRTGGTAEPCGSSDARASAANSCSRSPSSAAAPAPGGPGPMWSSCPARAGPARPHART